MSEPLIGPELKRTENTFKTCSLFFWVVLFFFTASVVSLAAALFSYGPVYQAAGFAIWHTFYSYVLTFPLLGIFIAVYFPFLYTKNVLSCSKGAVLAVLVPYAILLTAIVVYMIYQWVVDCDAGTAAAYCWDGLNVHWQWLWVLFSILVQWLMSIVQIIISVQVFVYARKVNNERILSKTQRNVPGSTVDNNVSGAQVGRRFGVAGRWDQLTELLTLEAVKVHDKV